MHHAILNPTDDILTSFEKGQSTLGVFIDLSKACNTLNHSILLNELELYEIKDKCLNWFKSYLKHRKQFGCVAEGFILGSLLLVVVGLILLLILVSLFLLQNLL